MAALCFLFAAFGAQLLGQGSNSAAATPWLTMDELSITTPLPSGKRFLGWYVDGAWNLNNQLLTLLNFESKTALLTNNLVPKGSQLHFSIAFKVELDSSRAPKKPSAVKNTEVIAFDFSNRLYSIKEFDERATVADLGGYSLFFFRRAGRQLALLKPMTDQGLYNLQMVFEEEARAENGLSCAYDYLNAETQLDVFFDFDHNLFRVVINGKPCVTYSIDERLFPTPKATLSLVAYGSSAAPLSLQVKTVQISKVPLLDASAKPFHADADSLLRSLHEHDPLYHQSASLTNVLLLQGKTRAEMRKMAQLVELLAQRSLRLDETLTAAQQSRSPVLYEDPQYQPQLDDIVGRIQTMMDQNSRMKERFSVLEEKFRDFRPVDGLQTKLEELDSQISSISSLLTVHRHSKLLEEIEKFSGFLDKHHIGKLMPEHFAALAPSPLETVVKVVAGFIFFMIFVLVGLIIRTINYGVKNHIF